MRITLLFVVMLVVLAATGAFADRLVLTPTGSVLDKGQVRAEAAFSGSDATGGILPPAQNDSIYWLSVGLGLVELEGARYQPPTGGARDIISAELGALPETIYTPAIGVGVRDIGNQSSDGRGYYLAISKTVPLSDKVPFMPIHDLKTHIGVGAKGIRGFFAGAEVGLPLKLNLSAEYDSRRFNAALTWDIIPKVGLKVYSLDGDIFYGANLRMGF
jgi:hypothetical protein